MSEAKHTEGRVEWVGSSLEVVGCGNAVIDPSVGCMPHCYGGSVDLGLSDANAARLAACWNACEGIPDPEALRRERDEAVEVLKEIAAMGGLTLLGPDSRHHMGDDATCYHEQGAAKAFEQAADAARAFLAKLKEAP